MPKQVAENKMGVMPVNKLLISMSVPMMLSMLIQALYNVVDSMFVAQVSENALTAVSLAFPIQNLMIAVGTGTGVGINALLSRSLGEKNFKRVNKTANHAVFLALLSFFVFACVGIFCSRAFFEIQTDISEIVDFGTSYMTICCVFSVGLFGQFAFERLLQSTGKTFYTMITQLIGAIINIILDPIMIFGYFGFPEMGVAGAALATVTGQIVACIVAVVINKKKNTEITMSLKKFRPSGKIIKRIYSVGIPSIIMVSISSIMNFGMNVILLAYSSTAAAVFGIYFKLQSFVFMPVFGLNNGMVPIIAYNYGARKKARITKTIKLSIIYAVGIMLIGLLVFQLFPAQLLSIFNASQTMMGIGTTALHIISLSFVCAGFGIVTSSVFQALGNGVLSMVVSIVRQLVVLLPVAYLFSVFGGLDTVWWAFPIAEVAAVVLCILFLKRVYKKEINPLVEEQDAPMQEVYS